MERALRQLAQDAVTLAAVCRVRREESCSVRLACEIVGEKTGRSMETVRRAYHRAKSFITDSDVEIYIEESLI